MLIAGTLLRVREVQSAQGNCDEKEIYRALDVGGSGGEMEDCADEIVKGNMI